MQKNHVDRGDACGCFSKDPWDGPLTVEMHHTVLSVELRDGFLRYESPYMNRANLYDMCVSSISRVCRAKEAKKSHGGDR